MKNTLIESHLHILMGKPVIAGPRITGELSLEKLAAGETKDDLIAAYPRLSEPAIAAALQSTAKQREA